MAKRSDDKRFEINVLSYKRINNCSDGLFFGKSSEDKTARKEKLNVRKIGIRGPMEARPDNPVKAPKDPLNPNPQIIDTCRLSNDLDTLVVQYHLQIVDTPVPYNCDNANAKNGLYQMHKVFAEEGVYNEVARRIAINIANARSLWRNRQGCKEINVKVEMMNGKKTVEKEWDFNALEVPLSFKGKTSAKVEKEVDSLASEIASVYRGDVAYRNFRVTIEAVKFWGMEVFPSQEMPANRSSFKPGDQTKFLYNIDGQAAFHPQKITNALLCIDDWYPGLGEPISVNAFGTVSQEGFIGREPKERKDIYNLFDSSKDELCGKIEQGDKNPAITSIEKEDMYYVAAMLIRGGVFAKSGKTSEA